MPLAPDLAAALVRLGQRAVPGPSPAVLRRLEREELVRLPVGAAPELTELGRLAVERAADPEHPNRWMTARGRSGRTAVTANLGESPLGWLYRRDKISARQFAAGERLRRDHEMAQRPPSVTMRWDAGPGRSGGRPADGPLDPSSAQIAAGARVEAAQAAAGPGLREVLGRVVLGGEGLESAERAMGWPARAGKVVLQIALDRLAAHYRLPDSDG